jgi:antitoxin StbD
MSNLVESLGTNLTISMSVFKVNPTKVLREANGKAVAVLNHNKAAFYMLEPRLFEALMDVLDDAQMAPSLKERWADIEKGQYKIVSLDDL